MPLTREEMVTLIVRRLSTAINPKYHQQNVKLARAVVQMLIDEDMLIEPPDAYPDVFIGSRQGNPGVPWAEFVRRWKLKQQITEPCYEV